MALIIAKMGGAWWKVRRLSFDVLFCHAVETENLKLATYVN